MNINKFIIFKTIKIFFYICITFVFCGFLFSIFFRSHSISRLFFSLCSHICHQGDVFVCVQIRILLPLCFRCSGMYIFLAPGALVTDICFKKIQGHFNVFFLITGTLPLILDGFFNITATLGMPIISFFTGALFGFTCGLAIMYGINGILVESVPNKKNPVRIRPYR